MDFNYHTHTHHCGHASGTPEEYVRRAIEGGIRYMGFSDHSPFIFPNGHEAGYRVPVAQAAAYAAEIAALREKYQDQIELAIGYEMEYYPAHFDRMLETARRFGGEYLILGQHYLYEESTGQHTIFPTDRTEDLRDYVACITAAIDSGVFTYIAHPDVLNFTGAAADYRAGMREICAAAKAHNVPLEINCLGIRDGRHYPYEPFWAIAGETGAPVTCGFDAHDAASAYDGASLIRVQELVDTYGLNNIGRPTLRDIRQR